MSEWQSTDNPPTHSDPVLVVWMGKTQDITFFYEDEMWWSYDPFAHDYRGEPVLDCHLSHWQPLPEPPK